MPAVRQVVQLDRKWEDLGGLQQEAERGAQAVAKLEADVARTQAELDALPEALPAPTQAQGTPDMLALKEEMSALNTQVGRPSHWPGRDRLPSREACKGQQLRAEAGALARSCA
jgi:hypothetical protein